MVQVTNKKGQTLYRMWGDPGTSVVFFLHRYGCWKRSSCDPISTHPTTPTNQAAVTSPGVRNQPTPTLIPTHHQTPKPTIAPTHAPLPTSPPCQATNGNPWCYNFLLGKLIYSPPAGFCTYFACIPSFVEPDDPGDGYIVQCRDGLFSQAGGERGACSHHGWVSRPLYSH